MRFLGKPRRGKGGVGSLIGAVFIAMILLSGFTFYSLYLGVMDHYNKTSESMNESDWKRNQEKLVIKNVGTTSSNKLNVTVENQGTVASHLIWFGIVDKTSVPENQAYYALDMNVVPSGIENIVSDFAVTVGRKYVVQLITELGNGIENKFYPASDVQCRLSLTAASPTTYVGNNVTVMLTVTHNDTEIDTVQSLTASISVAPGGLVQLVGNSPLTVNGLERGESAFFWWVYNTISTGTASFNATYSSAPAGSYALTSVNILASPAQGGGGNVSVAGVNGTAEYNPSQWNPLGSTQYVSGSVADLASNDSNYAIFRSYYSGTTTNINHTVDNNSSNVDGSPNIGNHSNFTAMRYGPDSIYDTLTEGSTGQIPTCYYPSGYNMLGSTQLVSGTLSNLQTDDGAYMTFRSYQSASSSQSLYAHSETANVGGTSYYVQRLISADGTATNLAVSMNTVGRNLWGKFVYPLTGISSIPASTWATTYRTWKDTVSAISFDAASSVQTSTTATSVSWSHTTGTGYDRLLLVAVGVHVASGTPTTVTSATYGGVALTQVTTALYSATSPQVRTYIFSLVNPVSGTNTIVVTFAASTLYVCGAATYSGVDQTTPIQISNTATGSGTSQSVSVTVSGAGRAVFGHFSGHRTSSWTITEGTGQNNRWSRTTYLYKGKGSDKLNVVAGPVSMSWTTSGTVDWVCSAVVINPASTIGHASVDILIRKSDNTIRTTIATDMANSIDLTTTAATLGGTYSWTTYSVIDQTDYLEVDYYVDVTTAASGVNAYLRIDDPSLGTADQTKTANVMLPSEYTVEVEFLGTSDTLSWSQLMWMVDSSFTASGVTATFQLYNYTASAYAMTGDGYMTDTIGTTNVTKTQTITVNSIQFRDASGNWRMKIKGVKATNAQFDWRGDFTEYKEFAGRYSLDLETQWTNVDFMETNEELAIYVCTLANTHSLDATGGYMIVGNGTPDWGSMAGTISFWVKMDSSVQGRFWGQDGDMETRWSGNNLVLDWGGTSSMTSATSFSANKWYFVAIVWDENNDNLFLYVGDQDNPPARDANSLSGTWTSTLPAPTQNRFLNGLGGDEPLDGHGDDLRYWNIARSGTQLQSDYNVELAGSEPNLRSYFKLNNNFDDIGPNNDDGSSYGSHSFSSDVAFGAPSTENIGVDVWNGSGWQSLSTSLAGGWNNVSVTPYLTSANFTIRFKDSNVNDTSLDSWDIDVALLHLWTLADQYTAEVEFSGSANAQNWTSLLWQIQSCWNITQVTVVIQFYNFTLGNYMSSGNGYLTYVSNMTPNTNELMSKTEISSPNDFKNSTGYWRVKIKGVKSTSTQFVMKADWIDFQSTYSTTGETMPYNVWQWYSLKATTTTGDPIPYAYVSIYSNGTSIAFRNATDKTSIPNPAWIRLDASGAFQLEVKSTSSSAETFVLYAVVGSIVGQEKITQEAP